MPRTPAHTARDAALLRLMELHHEDYDRLYDDERVARGLAPLRERRDRRIAQLEMQIARLTARGKQNTDKETP